MFQHAARKKHSGGYVEEGNRPLHQYTPRLSLLQRSCLVGVCSQSERGFHGLNFPEEVLRYATTPESVVA